MYGYYYDKLNRLTDATYYDHYGNDFSEKEMRYDLNGNLHSIIRAQNDNQGVLWYDYRGNQPVGYGWSSEGPFIPGYEYDANGNLCRETSGVEYRYNLLNLLESITGNLKQSHSYDGVKRTVEGIYTQQYLGSLTYRSPKGGTLSLDAADFGEGVILATGEANYYVKDHLGSVRAVVNADGSLNSRYDYYPFGCRYLRDDYPVNNNRHMYIGKEPLDAQMGWGNWGRHFDFGARVYFAPNAVWFQPDPLAEWRPGISPYAFCSGNPVNRVDRDGRWDDNYEITIDEENHVQINVERNDDPTNTYTLVTPDGEIVDLGTYEKTSDNMVKMDQSTDFYTQPYYSQGNIYYDGDAAAGFLAAAYTFNQVTGSKVTVTQFMTEGRKHSGHSAKIPCVDIRYTGNKPGQQPLTNVPGSINYRQTATMLRTFTRFGYDNMGVNNFLTENGDQYGPVFLNTRKWPGHQNHIHVQGFNKSLITIK